MADFLYSIDVALFHFINQTLSNPAGDVGWPLITDYAGLLPVRVVLGALWVWLIIKGGRKGRTAALMIIPLLFLSDKLSSELIKPLVNRPRPCHQLNGLSMVQDIHLLVGCGSGKSFPSSHAVNNFAVATVFAFYYRKWKWAFYFFAALVAVSRIAVGVHYPSDVLGGAVIGVLVALFVVWAWTSIDARFIARPAGADHPYLDHEPLSKDT